jgi:hypothetical protein
MSLDGLGNVIIAGTIAQRVSLSNGMWPFYISRPGSDTRLGFVHKINAQTSMPLDNDKLFPKFFDMSDTEVMEAGWDQTMKSLSVLLYNIERKGVRYTLISSTTVALDWKYNDTVSPIVRSAHDRGSHYYCRTKPLDNGWNAYLIDKIPNEGASIEEQGSCQSVTLRDNRLVVTKRLDPKSGKQGCGRTVINLARWKNESSYTYDVGPCDLYTTPTQDLLLVSKMNADGRRDHSLYNDFQAKNILGTWQSYSKPEYPAIMALGTESSVHFLELVYLQQNKTGLSIAKFKPGSAIEVRTIEIPGLRSVKGSLLGPNSELFVFGSTIENFANGQKMKKPCEFIISVALGM